MMTDTVAADPAPVPDAADDPKIDSASDAAVETVEESRPVEDSRPVEKMEAGPLVLRVKRRVDDHAAPAITVHPKRVRLNSQSDVEPSVFRLAGTLDCASDDAEISSLVARVISAPGDSETSDSGARPRAQRRRRRRHLRVMGGKRRHDSDLSEATSVRLLDAEEEDAYGPSLSEYRRQLAGLTMNDEPLECQEVEAADKSYVYDLYVLNEPRNSFGEMFTGIDSDDDDDFGWALTMDDYLDENYAPLGSLDDKEWKQWRTMEADCDSNPDSESNWRNDYPDLDAGGHPAPFEEEEFDLFMAGREPERLMRDSDDEDPIAAAMRQMEISPGVEITEVVDGEEIEGDAEPPSAPVYRDLETTFDYLDAAGDREEFDLCMAGREPDLEAARERLHNRPPPGPLSVRRLAGELAAERRRQRIELG